MSVIGMDIRYSNLKIVYGDKGGDPILVNRPAGAAPSDHIRQRIMGDDDAVRVLVNGREFAAAISHDRIENCARELHFAARWRRCRLAGRRSVGLPAREDHECHSSEAAPQVTHAADDDDDGMNENGFVDGEAGRVYVGNVMGVQRPRYRLQNRAQHEGMQLRQPHIFAQALTENLILADVHQNAPKRRAFEVVRHPKHQRAKRIPTVAPIPTFPLADARTKTPPVFPESPLARAVM